MIVILLLQFVKFRLFYSFEKCPGVGGFHSVVTICEFFNIILEVFVSFIHSAHLSILGIGDMSPVASKQQDYCFDENWDNANHDS